MRCWLTNYMLLCEFNAESLSVCTLFNEYKSRTRLRNNKELWECFFNIDTKNYIVQVIIAPGVQAGRPGDRGSIIDRGKHFSSSLCVQTGSEAHPASCTMGTGGSFPGVKRGRSVMLTTHPNLVPRSRMSRSYIPSHVCRLRGIAGHLYFTYTILNEV
jgi:hypothetical protein